MASPVPSAVPVHRLADVARLTASGAIDFSRPFIIVTPHAACTEPARDQLRAFEDGTYTGTHQHTHAVRRFAKDTDRYLNRDMQISAAQMAAMIKSGEARDHDVYWAYYKFLGKGEAAPAVGAFREIESALALQVDGGVESAITLWAGPAGHVEYLHYDDESNLHLAVCGKKRWLVFPPTRVCKLNFVSLASAIFRHFMGHPESSIGPPKRGLTGGPSSASGEDFAFNSRHYFGGDRFSNREHTGHWSKHDGMEIVLNPGDALYVPAGWPHEVTGEEDGSVRPNTSADDQVKVDSFADSFVLSMNAFYRAPRWALCCCCCARTGRPGLHGVFAWWSVFRLKAFSFLCH
jgi:hypothetical protein